ncbi:MAG: hypothetical protein DK306_002252 [Chloroflexi bacterium]|nr:MAG: hypothetical protein DK306_002252 [Chloroflexota bacterium]
MFEAEAAELRRSGVQIGSDSAAQEEARLLDAELERFGLGLRTEALEMARLYALVYCFENSVRDLINDRLTEKSGASWWLECVPKKVKDSAESRHKTAVDESWLEGSKGHPVAFVDFGHLESIITSNWEHFEDLIPSQIWLKQRLLEMEQARNFIAHNRALLPGEFQRLYMYVNDWNRQVGL